MAVYRRLIPSTDPRLKRHVEHDDRSRAFAYPTAGLAVESIVHARHIGILDQLDVGSCTGEAGIGDVATEPLFQALPTKPHYTLDQPGAYQLYSDAEDIDGDGPYPPQDNGSTGLSIAKALKNAGLIAGYQHTFSLDDALKALSQTPVMVGSYWYDDMFNPDEDGQLHIGGNVAGGHEYLIREVDAGRERVWLDNSWGLSWGVAGRAYLPFATFGTLLQRDGDVTIPLPLTVPAPTPQPQPLPPSTDPDGQLAAVVRLHGWVTGRHIGENARAAHAVQRWLEAKGL